MESEHKCQGCDYPISQDEVKVFNGFCSECRRHNRPCRYCGKCADVNYDQFGCEVGFVCETCYLKHYRTDHYNPADYGERIEPLG